MPVYSLDQWRAAVGKMAVIAASRSYKQKRLKNKEINKRKSKSSQLVLLLSFFLLTASSFIPKHQHQTKDTRAIEPLKKVENNCKEEKSPSKPDKKRKPVYSMSPTKCSFILMLVILLSEAVVSLIVISMLLMRSGDVEPNPGPTTLSNDDLIDVKAALLEAKVKWMDIGLVLRVSQGDLESIKQNYSNDDDRLLYMLIKWFNVTPKPCWENVAEALSHSTVGRVRMAMKVRDTYCEGYKFLCEQNEKERGKTSILDASNSQSMRHTQLDTIICKTLPKAHPGTTLQTGKMDKTISADQGISTPDSSEGHNSATPSHVDAPATSENTVVESSKPKVTSSSDVILSDNKKTEQQLQMSFEDLKTRAHNTVSHMNQSSCEKLREAFHIEYLLPSFESACVCVWDQLSPHFHFLDCSLLELLISHTDDSQLQSDMQDYRLRLEAYAAQTSAVVYAEHFSQSSTTQKSIQVQLHKPLREYTCDDIIKIKEKLANAVELPTYALMFFSGQKNSCSIEFKATNNFVAEVFSRQLPLLESQWHESLKINVKYATISEMTCFHSAHKYLRERNIHEEYDDLESDLGEILDKTGDEVLEFKPPTKFFNKFTTVPTCHKWHKKFLKSLLPKKEKIEEVWFEVKFYINCFNYGLLEHIIGIVDNDGSLKKEMQIYKHKNFLFLARTKLCDFINIWQSVDVEGTPPENLLEQYVTLRVKLSWEECTLKHLEESRRSLTSRFFLPEFAVFLTKAIESKSISMKLLASAFVTSMIEEEMSNSEEYFTMHGIIGITIFVNGARGERVLLPRSTNEVDVKAKIEEQQHIDFSVNMEVKLEAERLEVNFGEMMRILFAKTREQKIIPQLFIFNLTTAIVDSKFKQLPTVKDLLPKVDSSIDPNQRWEYTEKWMESITNYLNYEILQHAIAILDDPQLKQDMEQYAKEMDTFRKESKMSQLMDMDVWPLLTPPEPRTLVYLRVILTSEWKEYHLQDLFSLRSNLANYFSHPQCSFLLYDARGIPYNEIICVFFLIPPSLAELIHEMMEKDTIENSFLAAIGAISICLLGFA